MPKNDGGPAFPKADTVETKDVYYGDFPTIMDGGTGMSLRDYFAAKAMQAIMSVLHEGIRPMDIEKMTADAYLVADAMIEARTK